MLEQTHHMIFYPEDAELLEQATLPRKTNRHISTLPSSILVPHAAYPYCLDLLHQAFGTVGESKPKLIVFLGTLHQEILEEHEPAFLITAKSDAMTIGGKTTLFATDVRAAMLAEYNEILRADDSYFMEESAFELTLPLIESYFPATPVLALLAGSCDAKRCKQYAQLLAALVNREESCLFIVSTNANALLSSPQSEQHAQTLCTLLEEGSSLLESANHHQISACNIASLEAIRMQTWGKATWNILGYMLGTQPHNGIIAFGEGKEKHVWHLAAYRGTEE